MVGITQEGKSLLLNQISNVVTNTEEADILRQGVESLSVVMENDIWYTTEQVAQKANLSPYTVRAYRKQFGIGTKISKEYYFSTEDVQKIVKRNKRHYERRTQTIKEPQID